MSTSEAASRIIPPRHTPGPWVVLGRENQIGDIGIGPADRSACPVAVVQECGKEGEARDNASLLATAPELADALVALVEDFWRRGLAGRSLDNALEVLRKAGRLTAR